MAMPLWNNASAELDDGGKNVADQMRKTASGKYFL